MTIETSEDDQPDRHLVVVVVPVAVAAAEAAEHPGVEAEAREHRGEHREEARERHDRTSRFAMCESSCASTASTSCGSSRLPEPLRHGDGGVLRVAAGRERVRDVGGDDGDARLRQVGHRAEPLDHRVQLGRLLGGDDLRAGRRERELVGRPVLEDGDADDDHEHRREADVQHVEEDDARRRRRAGRAGRSSKSIRSVRPLSRPNDLRFTNQMVLDAV